jgi:hypothetical protein
MAAAPHALALLEANQHALQRLFAEYADLVRHEVAFARRIVLAERICTELAIWRRLRDELVDPAAGIEAGLDGGIGDTIAQVLAARTEEEGYDARVEGLRGQVDRQLKRESALVFLRLRAAGVDLHQLGDALTRRRQELQTVADALREDALASALL